MKTPLHLVARTTTNINAYSITLLAGFCIKYFEGYDQILYGDPEELPHVADWSISLQNQGFTAPAISAFRALGTFADRYGF